MTQPRVVLSQADQCVAELQAMKDRHRRADEALAARVDAATAELTAASEVRRAALGRREASDRKAAALQARLAGMPATGDALREAEERERQARPRAVNLHCTCARRATAQPTHVAPLQAREVLMRKQQELSEQDLESRADELVLQVADATRKAQRLRARRDQLAQAAASTARLRRGPGTGTRSLLPPARVPARLTCDARLLVAGSSARTWPRRSSSWRGS